jgi:hypothetical protein
MADLTVSLWSREVENLGLSKLVYNAGQDAGQGMTATESRQERNPHFKDTYRVHKI